MKHNSQMRAATTHQKVALNMNKQWTSKKLFDAFYSNDSQLQNSASEFIQNYLHPFAKKYSHGWDHIIDAEDAVQTTLLKLLEGARKGIRPDNPDKFLSYITQTMYRYLHTTKERAEKGDNLPPLSSIPPPEPDSVALDKEISSGILALVNQAPFSTRSRYVVVGKYIGELSDDEMAEELTDIEGKEVKRHHVQKTRSENFSKIRNPDWIERFKDLF